MNKAKTPNWQPLTRAPVLVEMTRDMLASSNEQRSKMEQAIKRPYVLEDEALQRTFKLYTEQNEFVTVYLEQCRRWRNETLNAKQQEWVDEIESNMKALEKINQEIVSIANHCKSHSINKVMANEDSELAFDVFSGKSKFDN